MVKDGWPYYCIKCNKVSDHVQVCKKFMKCNDCGIKGTCRQKNCDSCSSKTYVFQQEGSGKLLCKKCMTGFSPKNVTGVVPMPCLFCDDELQTWYIYESLNSMRC